MPHVTNPCVVVVNGSPQALKLHAEFDADDEVVRLFPWAFAPAEVESATAAPGERRNVRRP